MLKSVCLSKRRHTFVTGGRKNTNTNHISSLGVDCSACSVLPNLYQPEYAAQSLSQNTVVVVKCSVGKDRDNRGKSVGNLVLRSEFPPSPARIVGRHVEAGQQAQSSGESQVSMPPSGRSKVAAAKHEASECSTINLQICHRDVHGPLIYAVEMWN